VMKYDMQMTSKCICIDGNQIQRVYCLVVYYMFDKG